MSRPHRRFQIALLCGCLVVALGIWLSSGTMTPYAITHASPKVLPPCNYLANPDHPHFEWVFAMLDRQPREVWQQSTMLRRILFPLLAYPAMKLFGFLAGGVVTSIVLNATAFAAFAIYIRKRIGQAAAIAAVALIATYPGIYYWAGLPYPHAIIAALSLVATILVCEMERSETTTRIALLSLGLGILFTGYDLAPFFLPPVLIILLMRRKFAASALSLVLMLLPMVIVLASLKLLADIPLYNENSSAYSVILKRYFTYDVTFLAWMKHISHWPVTLVKTYFWHNFVFLPALFLIVPIGRRVRPTRPEFLILALGMALFLFNNLAPPYRGWQFRGEGVSRIYQPVFAAMVLLIVRAAQASPRRWLIGAIGVTCAINLSIVLGPVTKNPLAAWTYHKFYQHAPEPQMIRNLDLFGRRPLGVCSHSPAKSRKKKPSTAPSTLSSVAAPSRDG